MAIFAEHAEHRRDGGFQRFRVGIAWLGLAMMLCLSGCGGCRKTPQAQEQEKRHAEEKAKKKEKEKEPFQAGQPALMPSVKGYATAGTCKPGHWVSQVWPDVKSNGGDFQGELETEIADAGGRKVPVSVSYDLTNQRPAVLAKEQPKSLETCIWIPPRADARLNIKLSAGGGQAVIERPLILNPMPSYRYYFIVLSQAPGRYEYLDKDKNMHSIRAHSKPGEDPGPKYYEVVSMRAGAPGGYPLAGAGRRPSLPTNALCWTSIAYLLWDDFDPAQCDLDQQRAMIDWLHWGGQIIVSGPDALEQLRNSFLRPYLPASVAKSRSFSADDLDVLSYWNVHDGKPPQPVRPWPGAELTKDPQAEYLLNTGKLLVERQVGRGRIVASAFRLTGPELTGWPGYDCFFNACLLRRPARFYPDAEDMRRFQWAGSGANACCLDAAKMTAVRYFARDAGISFNQYAADVLLAQKGDGESGFNGYYNPPPAGVAVDANGNPMSGNGPVSTAASSNSAGEFAPIPNAKESPGLGAWNDRSPVAQAAGKVVDEAARITVPARSFIVWVVVGYLCVLVPANWIVFRLLGRVEWAWIAAPLIAIACTVVVIKQAQLNIGFARSRNEVAVIEMQAGYPRAHVARYTALYTSLATRYEFRLGGPCGQILPFSPDAFQSAERDDNSRSLWQAHGELLCRRGDGTQLSGFEVGSNVADFVHSEEMADFGGTVTLHQDSDGALRVTNGTPHPLDDCQAVRGQPGGRDLARIVGRLEPGATAALKFEPFDVRGQPLGVHGVGGAAADMTIDTPDRRKKPAAEVAKDGPGDPSNQPPKGPEPGGELRIEGIEKVALERQDLRPGEICLLARVVGDVPGLTITPAAQQTRQSALLVAHLCAGDLPAPERDKKPATSASPGTNGNAENANDE